MLVGKFDTWQAYQDALRKPTTIDLPWSPGYITPDNAPLTSEEEVERSDELLEGGFRGGDDLGAVGGFLDMV